MGNNPAAGGVKVEFGEYQEIRVVWRTIRLLPPGHSH